MHLPLPKVPNRKKLKPMKRIAVMVNPDDYSVPVSSMADEAPELTVRLLRERAYAELPA
jgi:hypothetical protein